MNSKRTILFMVWIVAAWADGNNAYAQSKERNTPLVIQEQGSFATGGTVTTDKERHQFHGDHDYVFYQKPAHPHKYPIAFPHGIHQASKTWNAGRGQVGMEVMPVYDEQSWYTKWRIGFYELDTWRIRLGLARQWVEAVNSRGGDVTLIHLPEIGIMGNTHFPMSDLNNVEVANVISRWLHEKGMD